MAKLPLVMCRACRKTDIDRNIQIEGVDWVMPRSRYYYHKKCYDDWIKKKDDIHADVENDTLWRDATYDFLTRDLKLNIRDKFFSQWKNYMNSQKYTAKGIYFAIRYFYNVQKGDPSKAEGGIGIIPYIYSDACSYWVDQERKTKGIVADIERQLREAEQRTKKVVIQKQIQPRKMKIDLSSIEEMEDEEW